MTYFDYYCRAEYKIKELFKRKDIKKIKKIIELVDKLYTEKGMTETLNKVYESAISKKDAILCYKLAKILQTEDIMKDLQTVVLEDKNAILCFLFARDVKRADVKELQKVVVDSNDAFWCYMFAHDIKGAEIKPLQQVVINSRNVSLCRDFAYHIDESDEKALLSVTAAFDVEKAEKELNSIINKY